VQLLDTQEAAVEFITRVKTDNVAATKNPKNPKLALHAACVVARIGIMGLKARDAGSTLVVFGFGRLFDMLLQVGFDPAYMCNLGSVRQQDARRAAGKLPRVSDAYCFETDPASSDGENVAELVFPDVIGEGEVHVHICVNQHLAATRTAGNNKQVTKFVRAMRRALIGDVEGKVVVVPELRKEFFDIELELDRDRVQCEARAEERLTRLARLDFKDSFLLPVEARRKQKWPTEYNDPANTYSLLADTLDNADSDSSDDSDSDDDGMDESD
jgi:hypothetical protein